MSLSQYSYTTLKNIAIDQVVYPNIDAQIDTRSAINEALRQVHNEVYLRSSKRISQLASKLFNYEYEYPLPSDVLAQNIIDLAPQDNRPVAMRFQLVKPDYFDRFKSTTMGSGQYLAAIVENDLARRLRVSGTFTDPASIISNLAAVAEVNASWAVTGGATNLTVNGDNFIVAAGSLSFDIDATVSTTAGITLVDGFTPFDITNELTNGSCFVWAYIPVTTNITNYFLRLGSDAANYYQMTTTTQADNTAFQVGWNLLRFNFASKTTVGAPVSTAIDSATIAMTKAVGKVSETGYQFNLLNIHLGSYFNITYYTNLPWTNAAGTYIANSTLDTDLVVADPDEIDLIAERVRMEVFRTLRLPDERKLSEQNFGIAAQKYKIQNPPEFVRFQNLYYTQNNSGRYNFYSPLKW